LAEALHIRHDEVQKWIDRGWLKSRSFQTSGLKMQIIDPDDFADMWSPGSIPSSAAGEFFQTDTTVTVKTRKLLC
jgi:hypothetical protein